MRALVAAVLLLALAAAPAPAKTIDAKFGEPFKLRKSDKARFDGGRGVLRITRFVNSPCPKGARCVWSGQLVRFGLTLDGKPAPPDGKDAPYAVTVKDSDYKTYATVVVDSRPASAHDAAHDLEGEKKHE